VNDIVLNRDSLSAFNDATHREWLVTSRVGGFACGTLAGLNTRRYHGLLGSRNPASLE
jgi:hypothetical protein